ncbi:MAG: hypothetical protein HKN19_19215 [Halioglobus sp.]|nr:hypothetical protein [Halioglobus sp.]
MNLIHLRNGRPIREEDFLQMAKTGILLASAIAGFGGFFWLMNCKAPEE